MAATPNRLVALGVPYPTASEFATQLDSQKDIFAIQSNVAAVGSVLSQAVSLTGDIVHIGSTSYNSNDSVKLRVGTTVNAVQRIINRGVSPLKVYPPTSGGKIDALSAGSNATLSSGQQAHFMCINVTNQEFIGKY